MAVITRSLPLFGWVLDALGLSKGKNLVLITPILINHVRKNFVLLFPDLTGVMEFQVS